ncbi:MAG: ammonia-forming cytochrome c nitrite reductase subunit c552 [Coriobacteriia bacterium]|nr:ammonia-forming cytochrome c nitrite reductase subunit c552 [Coriobacteriia bacterium]
MRHSDLLPHTQSVLVLLCALLLIGLAGCGNNGYEKATVTEARELCAGSECHDVAVDAHASGPHAAVSCSECHEGASDHAKDPEGVSVVIDWRIDSCARCHETVTATYLYDDNTKVGPFGGSQREPAIHKADEFPQYNTIVAGHGFTRDYREEGAHLYMLEDHYDTLRGKFETCVQCKSTKIAWAWNTGTILTVPEDRTITLTHTATDDSPAREVVVPAGTTLEFDTDFRNYEVLATAQYAGGRTYTSRPDPDDNATEHQNMLWAATIAAIKETMPYGAGCNHCHDPHSGSQRLIRATMLEAIEHGGVNPYDANTASSFETASARDRETLLCAQCHVEYTCGRSGVDGMVRDHFGWTKAANLHEEYTDIFGYRQDWVHAIIGDPLIKSQHPETELYWNSPHYDAGASCASCHMPRVRTVTGQWVRSHWFTSPYKYGNRDTFGAFAGKTGLRTNGQSNPCTHCHDDRTAQAIAGQEMVYERQKAVQRLLAASVNALGQVREAAEAGVAVKESRRQQALEAHRKAHVLWENLIVSENSMGFHNFDEVMDAMDAAEAEARAAIDFARRVLPAE